MIARFMPPEMIGASMARVSRPRSGIWNPIEPKLASVRNWGLQILNSTVMAISARMRPVVSEPSFGMVGPLIICRSPVDGG